MIRLFSIARTSCLTASRSQVPTALLQFRTSHQVFSTTMSWMDSWSRPSANSKVPAPLYLANADTPYCHTCGRVMNSKKTTKKQQTSSTSGNNEIKYCSSRCRGKKPGPLDRKIEKTIASLLNSDPDSGIEKTAAKTKAVKGDPRVIVTCDEIEEIVFGSRFDPEKTSGRRRNRKARGIAEKGEWKSVDMESSGEEDDESAEEASHDEDSEEDEFQARKGAVAENYDTDGSVDGGVRIRPPQDQSLVNFSVGGERGRQEKIEESADDLEKRRQGAKRAEEREMVRRAARRGVVFGFEVPRREGNATPQKKPGKGKTKSKKGGEDQDEGEEAPSATEIRKAEALMAGMVVEPSFAKGNWSIRWRD
ncbi:hypothetical protein CB0940_10828 [Cercospora beticola]|nr:hypothetical protein CB0940_10828 [Cercospora beticola]PIA96075.1 hypothetical protein CB0940_10828 [Cercospora beticola]